MNFAQRHELELAEIHVLAHDLDRQVRGSLEQVQLIRNAQRELTRVPGGRPDGEPLLAFVHIPKTAGGTVTSMLAAAYSKAEVKTVGNFPRNPEKTTKKLTRPRKVRGRVMVGHVPYGVFREYLQQDARYMTFLREPVDRVLSHYSRHIHRADPSRAGTPKALANPSTKANSLEEALVERRVPQLNNLATRFLCRDPTPMGELPASALEGAKSNLREFAFVGIQERFQESLVLLQRLLGLGPVLYVDRHVSPDRPSVEEISDEQRALIAEHNRLDVELYAFARELFEDAIAAAGQGFAADVEALRARDSAARDSAAREQEWRAAAFRAPSTRPGVRRHDQQLAEIHALTRELGTSTRAVLDRIREAREELASPPLLAFVHIPKTAGATVISMFAAAYSKAVRDAGNYLKDADRVANTVANPRRQAARVLAGHVPIGVFQEHLPPDTRYMTFLRDPVERVLSHYYGHVLAKDDRVDKAVRRPNRSGDHIETEEDRALKSDLLEEALAESRLPELTNLCTRFLCGHENPLGALSESAIDDAKENLRQFAFIGIQEHFEESLVLLQRMLGLGSIPYRDRHVRQAGSRPTADELPDDQRALILECNRQDAELYRFGLEMFEEAVAGADVAFREDVESLRARDSAAREEDWHAAKVAS